MESMQFIRDAAIWFITHKSPDLKDKVLGGLHEIENGVALEYNYRKLFGFILFDYSIYKGPSSFLDSEEAAKEIGVTEEVKYYANDWINYSKKTKQL